MNQDYLTAVLFERQLFDDGYDTVSLKERGLIKDPAKVLTEANAVVQKLVNLAKAHKIAPEQYTEPEAWTNKMSSFDAAGLQKFANELKGIGLDISANKNYQLTLDILNGGKKEDADASNEAADATATETKQPTATETKQPEKEVDDGAKALEDLLKNTNAKTWLEKYKTAVLYWAKQQQQGAK